MRIKNNSLSRKSEEKDVNAKIFIMMEGTDTEPLYFKEFFKNVTSVDYYSFQKERSENGWSNPKLLINSLILMLNNISIQLTYYDFLPFIIRHLKNTNQISDIGAFKRSFKEALHKRKIKSKETIVNEEVLKIILNEIKDSSFKDVVYNNLDEIKKEFSNYIDDKTYDSEIDKIILIVDRDKDSFSETQFDYVLKAASENNIDVYVTNPCFEFYLALHLSDLRHLKEEDILENKKINGNNFVTNELIKLDNGFSKTSFNVPSYINNVETALKNLNFYEEELEKLKRSIGSNLRTLIELYKS